MRALTIACAVLPLLAAHTVARAQTPEQLPERPPLCVKDDGTTSRVCRFVVTTTAVFVLIDYMAPLWRSDADPDRARGCGSVIKVPLYGGPCP